MKQFVDIRTTYTKQPPSSENEHVPDASGMNKSKSALEARKTNT